MTTRVIATVFAGILLVAATAHAQFLGDSLAAAGINVSERDAIEALAAAGVINNDPGQMAVSGAPPSTAKVYTPESLREEAMRRPAGTTTTGASEPTTSSPPSEPVSVPSGGGAYGFSGAEAHAASIDPKAAAAWHDAFRPVGTTMAKLPAGAITMELGGVSYSYVKGMFLQQKGGSWVVVPAPVGAAVSEKPVGAATVFAAQKPYMYYAGTFFVYDGSQKAYVVAQAPVGATVDYLPDSAKKMQRGGSVHYEYAGTFYKPLYRGNSVVYTVAS